LDRSDTKSGVGGGLLIYAKKGLNVFESFITPDIQQFNQYVSVKIPMKNKQSLSIVLVYRPHKLYNDNSVTENNDLLCNMLRSVKKPAVFLGDFNFKDIDWNNMTAQNAQSKNFVDAVQDSFCNQYVDFATHISGSILDLVIASDPNVIFDIEDLGCIEKSDHNALLCKLNVDLVSKDNVKVVQDWKNADIDSFKNDLNEIDWNSRFMNKNTEQCWNDFIEQFENIQLKHVPKKNVKTSKQPPWMNNSLLRLIRKKRRKWKIYKRFGNNIVYEECKELEKLIKSKVKNAKKKYERSLAKNVKNNSKPFYSYLKSKTSNRETIGPLKNSEGKLQTDNKSMADLLNSFFSSTFTKEDVSSIPQPAEPVIHHQMSDIQIDLDTVKKKILNLKKDSSPGPDGIRPRTLIELVDEVSIPLCLIMQKSYQTGEVPTDWRRANVSPIFKKGSKSAVGNYRPVSLTSIICKIMESILKDGIMDHLVINSLILSTQHGFMKNRSTLTNLLEYLNILTKLVDDGHCIDMIYLDFAKAFDKVPTQRLLAKMKSNGIKGKTLQWVHSWLTGREQRVVLLGEASAWSWVLSGVPQGSVLGPILFIIFINDLDLAVKTLGGILSKFADDSKAGRVVKLDADRDTLQKDLDSLMEWAETWQMTFNADKCKVLHFGKLNPRFSYTLGGMAPGGTVLQSVDEEKDLGVIISTDLKPSKQCAKAAKKANSVLGQMSRAVTYRDRITWVGLYKQYVRPHLEYCVQ